MKASATALMHLMVQQVPHKKTMIDAIYFHTTEFSVRAGENVELQENHLCVVLHKGCFCMLLKRQ